MGLKSPGARAHFARLLETDPFCHYCGGFVTRDLSLLQRGGGVRRATADHIVSRALGGTDAQVNIVLSCHGCNQRKGHEMACWCPTCCEAVAFYATRFLDPANCGGRPIGLRPKTAAELLYQAERRAIRGS